MAPSATCGRGSAPFSSRRGSNCARDSRVCGRSCAQMLERGQRHAGVRIEAGVCVRLRMRPSIRLATPALSRPRAVTGACVPRSDGWPSCSSRPASSPRLYRAPSTATRVGCPAALLRSTRPPTAPQRGSTGQTARAHAPSRAPARTRPTPTMAPCLRRRRPRPSARCRPRAEPPCCDCTRGKGR